MELCCLIQTIIVTLMCQVYSTLVFESVLTFAFAARDMYSDPGNGHVDVSSDALQCDQSPVKYWEYGRRLLQYIHNVGLIPKLKWY